MAASRGGPESDNLFVTDLPEGMVNEEVTQVLGQYGTIVSLKIVTKPEQTWTAALVRFSTIEEAKYVQESLNGGIPQGLETPITVRFANAPGAGKGGSFGKAATNGGPQRPSPYGAQGGCGNGAPGGGKGGSSVPMDSIVTALEASGQLPGGASFVNDEGCIFIRGLPRDCSDIHLYRVFAPFGPIYPKGVRACNTGKGDGSCRGYGFVNFLATESAQAAILTLNGAILPDGTTLKVAVKTDKPGAGQDPEM